MVVVETQPSKYLEAIQLTDRGHVIAVRGRAFVSGNLPDDVRLYFVLFFSIETPQLNIRMRRVAMKLLNDHFGGQKVGLKTLSGTMTLHRYTSTSRWFARNHPRRLEVERVSCKSTIITIIHHHHHHRTSIIIIIITTNIFGSLHISKPVQISRRDIDRMSHRRLCPGREEEESRRRRCRCRQRAPPQFVPRWLRGRIPSRSAHSVHGISSWNVQSQGKTMLLCSDSILCVRER